MRPDLHDHSVFGPSRTIVLATKLSRPASAYFRQLAIRANKTPSALAREILTAYLKLQGFTSTSVVHDGRRERR